MAYFRFRLVSLITRHLIDQSELRIAQIEAYDLIKVFDFSNWGLGSLGGIWGHLGSNYKNVPGQIIYQNDALDPEIKKKTFSRSCEVIRPQN